ncbi:MAG: UvrB/UvrC motif-containing protein [Deltaproteobacteria bacterium]|nr:UvrB/UvrC motif-containing protein [Deltaproteobacteria bacterium]
MEVRYLHSDITTMERVEIIIQDIESEMKKAVKELAFERAAELRDQIKELRELDLDLR